MFPPKRLGAEVDAAVDAGVVFDCVKEKPVVLLFEPLPKRFEEVPVFPPNKVAELDVAVLKGFDAPVDAAGVEEVLPNKPEPPEVAVPPNKGVLELVVAVVFPNKLPPDELCCPLCPCPLPDCPKENCPAITPGL